MGDQKETRVYKFLRWTEKYTKTDMVYLASGAFWLTLGQIISTVSSLLLTIAFANLVPKEVYGSFKYILSLTNILAISALSGMGTSIIRSVANNKEADMIPMLKMKMKWATLGSFVGLVAAGYYYINENITLTLSCLIVSVFLPFMNSFGIYDGLLQGRKLFKISTKYRVITQIISSVTLIITLFATSNILFILIAYFIPWTIMRAFFLLVMLKKFKPNQKSDRNSISYGKHLSFMGILKTIAGEADKILVHHFIGAAELAIYSIASAPITQMKSTIMNVKSLALPKFSKSKTSDLKKYLPKKIMKAELIIVPVVLIYIFIAPFIFKFFFPQYLDSILISQIISLTIVFVPRTLLSSSLVAKKQTMALYKIRVMAPLMRLATYFIFVYFYGLIGLAVARVASEIYLVMIYKYYFKRMK